MQPIRIFRHQDWIGPGHLTEVLDERQIPYELIRIDAGDSIPSTLSDTSALVFLGGTMSVNDHLPWMSLEKDLIRTAAELRFPMLGHCLGSQMISSALGGQIRPMPQKEIGWHRMTRLGNPTAEHWLSDLPHQFDLLVWHHDEFSMPPGATPLFTGDFCTNQSYVINENTLATIAHVEVTVQLLSEWLQGYGYDVDPVSDHVQAIEQIRKDIELKVAKMQQVTDVLYDRWLDGVLRAEKFR